MRATPPGAGGLAVRSGDLHAPLRPLRPLRPAVRPLNPPHRGPSRGDRLPHRHQVGGFNPSRSIAIDRRGVAQHSTP
eukprot:3861918-Pyramimonas_sp.AAC.1